MKRPILHVMPAGGIGDAILHTAAIRGWKAKNPQGRVFVYCTNDSYYEVLRENPHIDSLRRLTWAHYLFGQLPGVRRWVKQNMRVADYARVAPSLFGSEPAGRVIGEMLGVKVDDASPELHLTKDEIEIGKQRLASYRLPVALHVLGRCTENKQWPYANWEAVVTGCPQFAFIQLGLTDEPLIMGAVDLRGLTLRESFAVTKHCRAFVGVDSAPAHAAAALKIPAVVLFGPSSPEVWGHSTARNLYVQQRCGPCIDTLATGQCPYERACMSAISVTAVQEALVELIGTGGADGRSDADPQHAGH